MSPNYSLYISLNQKRIWSEISSMMYGVRSRKILALSSSQARTKALSNSFFLLRRFSLDAWICSYSALWSILVSSSIPISCWCCKCFSLISVFSFQRKYVRWITVAASFLQMLLKSSSTKSIVAMVPISDENNLTFSSLTSLHRCTPSSSKYRLTEKLWWEESSVDGAVNYITFVEISSVVRSLHWKQWNLIFLECKLVLGSDVNFWEWLLSVQFRVNFYVEM